MRTNGTGSFLKENAWGAANVGVGLAMGIASGQSMGTALKDAVIQGAAWTVAPEIMNAQMLYDLGSSIGPALVEKYKRDKFAWKEGFKHNMGGRGFADTQASATMRQRAVQAIQGSRLNARSALGREASLMHQGMGTPPAMRSSRMGW